MFSIKIISVGKLKESYLHQAQEEFMKRLKPYCNISIIEIKEEKFFDTTPRDVTLKKEAEKILAHIKPHETVIALTEGGQKFDSISFAKKIETLGQSGTHLTFIIGGPRGIDQEILQKSNYNFSLSALTFTHQMTRIILIEQIYRAMTIITGKKYHY